MKPDVSPADFRVAWGRQNLLKSIYLDLDYKTAMCVCVCVCGIGSARGAPAVYSVLTTNDVLPQEILHLYVWKGPMFP